MRRSRGISFKREQEQKLNSLLNKEGTSSRASSSNPAPATPVSLAPAVRPDFRSMREAIRDIRDTKDTKTTARPKSAAPRRQQVESEDEEEHETHLEEKYDEHSDDDRYEEEEEEEVKPVVKSRAMKPNNRKDEIKNKEVKEEEVKPKARGRKPKVQESREVREEDREDDRDHEEDHESERNDRNDRNERRREDKSEKKMIVPKSFFQKMTSAANIDTTSSDIYHTLQLEMIEYIVEVIKIVSNNDDEEIVVKDSNLRFLGEKDKAVGNLDVKLFEKLYGEAQKILTHNVTFTSESFKSLCKYTEIHLMDFLRKARAIMIHSGRKRLTLADIELLKFILE